MRSEREMYQLILGYAQQDPRVRGVILNGSRANPTAKLDQFRDYDIVYFVTDVAPFKEGDISPSFGEVLVMQRTDENQLFHEHFPRLAIYLMQFADGNRIDLTIAPVEDYRPYCFDDKLSVVLLDKDGFLPHLPPPDESTHAVERPSAQVFQECRNEFWWTAPYAVAGPAALCPAHLGGVHPAHAAADAQLAGGQPEGLPRLSREGGVEPGEPAAPGRVAAVPGHLRPLQPHAPVGRPAGGLCAVHPGQPPHRQGPGVLLAGQLGRVRAPVYGEDTRGHRRPGPGGKLGRGAFAADRSPQRKGANAVNILCIGDVVGSQGCQFLRAHLPALKKTKAIDLVIANGENSADGNGITPDSARYLLDSGVDVITTGNHSFRRRESYDLYDSCEVLLRPANYPAAAPGRGLCVVDMGRVQVGVINLMGTAFMESLRCPFETLDSLLKTPGLPKVVVVDFHAEATGEKRALGFYADGRVTALFGTHTHVPTADGCLLPHHTGYLTDAGMTGPIDSVLGVKPEIIIGKLKTKMPARFEWAKGPCKMDCVLFTAEERTGLCTGVERFSIT